MTRVLGYYPKIQLPEGSACPIALSLTLPILPQKSPSFPPLARSSSKTSPPTASLAAPFSKGGSSPQCPRLAADSRRHGRWSWGGRRQSASSAGRQVVFFWFL